MKRISLIFFLIYFLLPASLWADANTKAPRLGRLFFSIGERAILDAIRQGSKVPDKIITAVDGKQDEEKLKVEDAPLPSGPVVLKGYIRRSDGKNTLWLNDSAMMEKSANGELAVGKLNKAGQVQVTVNGAEAKTIDLKPGQVYDPVSGQIYNHMAEVPASQQEKQPERKSLGQSTSDALNPAALKSKIDGGFSNLTSAVSPTK